MEVTIRQNGDETTLFNVEGVWTENDTVWVDEGGDTERTFDGAEIAAVYTER